jgi:hypothetical protein
LLCVAAEQWPPKANANAPPMYLFFGVVEFIGLNEGANSGGCAYAPDL